MDAELVGSETSNQGAISTAVVVTPTAPKSISTEEAVALKEKAGQIIQTLQKQVDDRGFTNSIMEIGSEAQQQSGRKLELLKGRVGNMLNNLDGDSAQIPKDLIQMRMLLDQINPHVVQRAGFFSRILGRVPGVGDRLKEVAIKYESVQTQVDAIVASLRNGKDSLIKDNMSMEQLYDELKVEQVNVQKNAYLGELLLEELDRVSTQITDPNDLQRIQAVMHAVALRVQDLRTIEQVNMQFFISIDLTCNNNRLLSASVERTLNVTRNVITVGLSITAALVNQKKVLEATKATQEYAGNILAHNAAAIRKQTVDIQSLYKDPVLALEQIQKSYDDLIGAIDEVEKAKREGIATARSGIAKLSAMSSQLSEKVDSVRAGKIPDVPVQHKSIEA